MSVVRSRSRNAASSGEPTRPLFFSDWLVFIQNYNTRYNDYYQEGCSGVGRNSESLRVTRWTQSQRKRCRSVMTGIAPESLVIGTSSCCLSYRLSRELGKIGRA